MAMQLHELHPSLIHAPLIFLPTAAILDVMAVSSRSRVRRFALDAAGRRLWWLGVGAAGLAGAAGMAASQEIRLEEGRARDAMWLHGIGNVGIVLTGIGLASWRTTHRATAATAALGASAVGAALYTAWLGGELVYTHGAGVKALPPGAPGGIADSPPLLSARAPWRLLRDAAQGLAWLAARGVRLVARREPLSRGAATRVSEPSAVGTPGPEVAAEIRPS
jgi:uncharacterized membrane protein